MPEPRRLHFYGYVERPYEEVRARLHAGALDLFQRATTSAARRGQDLVAHLRVELAGVEIGVNVKVHARRVRDDDPVAGMPATTCVELDWEAARAPALFPILRAQLSAWPVTSTETQIEIEGDYQPPFRSVGTTVDALLLHRVAQASVHRFLEDVLAQLRREIPEAPR
jgi:hypothetical protein